MRQKKILLVDDEVMILRILARFLVKSGWQIYTATSGESALETFCRERPIDVLLCDIYLGAEDGWSLAESISRAQPDIGVVMLSGAVDMGGGPPRPPFTRLFKPFSPEELERTLDQVSNANLGV